MNPFMSNTDWYGFILVLSLCNLFTRIELRRIAGHLKPSDWAHITLLILTLRRSIQSYWIILFVIIFFSRFPNERWSDPKWAKLSTVKNQIGRIHTANQIQISTRYELLPWILHLMCFREQNVHYCEVPSAKQWTVCLVTPTRMKETSIWLRTRWRWTYIQPFPIAKKILKVVHLSQFFCKRTNNPHPRKKDIFLFCDQKNIF